MFFVLGFRGAWVTHAPPQVPKKRWPPVSGSRLARSPAWHGLPQCPGYGHWVSYCCVVLMLGFGFRGNPANPGWVLGWVCLGTGFGFSPPFLAGARGVCGWAWVLACIPPFLAGVLGRAWLCARSACTPPLLAGVCGVGVCAWLGLRLRAANPGCRVGVCACLCARSVCTPPLLAGVCGVAVCAWARVVATPCHSWLGCWGVCVSVCALRLYPATPGRGLRCGCVCLDPGFGCAPPVLAWVFGCVSVYVCTPPIPRDCWLGCAVWVCVLGLGFRLRPATPGWDVGSVCVCVRVPLGPLPLLVGGAVRGCVLWLGFQLRSPLLAGVLGCLCVCVRALRR